MLRIGIRYAVTLTGRLGQFILKNIFYRQFEKPRRFESQRQTGIEFALFYGIDRLQPGRYAWIAEVPSPAEKGMLQTFTVSAN
ncbi:MAG: hypothetical protein IIB74_03865 [Proteobacteria bacterium]|nr:hypothetical protein [Pseudomonadota bacterium]